MAVVYRDCMIGYYDEESRPKYHRIMFKAAIKNITWDSFQIATSPVFIYLFFLSFHGLPHIIYFLNMYCIGKEH